MLTVMLLRSHLTIRVEGLRMLVRLSGATTVTASGAVTGGSLTDGTATLASGALTGATNGARIRRFDPWAQSR